jgi:hypothetical protein
VLIGFALLILAVVSAIVGFRGWPGDTSVDGAGPMTVGGGATLVDFEPVLLRGGASEASGPAGAGTVTGARGAATAGGRLDVRGVAQSGGAGLVPGEGPAEVPGQPERPSSPATQEGGGVTGGLNENPGGPVETVEEAVEPVTEGVPEVGGGVTETLGGVGGGVQQKTKDLGLGLP